MKLEEKKKILCVADSLSMPRDGVSYEDTWVCKLQQSQNDYVVIPRLVRGLTSGNLRIHGEYLEYYNPQIIVLQVGIVDCAPRFLPSNSMALKVLNRLPMIIQSNFWKVYKKGFKRNPAYADISELDFANNLKDYALRCEQMKVEQLIFIKISHPGENMVKKNADIIMQIQKYNARIDEVCMSFPNSTAINPIDKIDNSLFVEDGYHLNGNGSDRIVNSLNVVLNRIK